MSRFADDDETMEDPALDDERFLFYFLFLLLLQGLGRGGSPALDGGNWRCCMSRRKALSQPALVFCERWW
jgi:hypothetical protein